MKYNSQDYCKIGFITRFYTNNKVRIYYIYTETVMKINMLYVQEILSKINKSYHIHWTFKSFLNSSL